MGNTWVYIRIYTCVCVCVFVLYVCVCVYMYVSLGIIHEFEFSLMHGNMKNSTLQITTDMLLANVCVWHVCVQYVCVRMFVLIHTHLIKYTLNHADCTRYHVYQAHVWPSMCMLRAFHTVPSRVPAYYQANMHVDECARTCQNARVLFRTRHRSWMYESVFVFFSHQEQVLEEGLVKPVPVRTVVPVPVS